ncbi:MAG: TolC family protein [Synergistaceae bacterium]|jgi:outer membrane protein TolC|nr:TolC family protein [Synergistaceae bacterium]
MAKTSTDSLKIFLPWFKSLPFRPLAINRPFVKHFNRAFGTVIAVLALAASAPGAFSAPPASSDLPSGAVTLEECIRIAVGLNPKLAQARSGITAQKAQVREAAASSRPQVSFSSSYGYSRNESVGQGGAISTGLTLRQSIFDWGRADLSIRGAEQELEAKTLDEANSVQDVIASVMSAYYMVNRSGRNLHIASERVGNYESRLEWAKDFYAAGTKAKIEVTKAETDLANARLDLVQANGAAQRAASGLAHSMGAAGWTPGGVKDLLEYTGYDITAAEAIETALAARSDLMAQEIRVEEARTSLSAAGKGLSPSFSGSAGYSFSGENDPLDQREWRLSVGLEIPVSDGGLTRERITGAEASLAGAEAQLDSMRQDVILAARNAHSSLAEAREAVTAAREAERQAKETLDLAQGRYRAGVGESLEISDAVDGYAQSRIRAVTALYDLKSAEINLKQTMGVISQ